MKDKLDKLELIHDVMDEVLSEQAAQISATLHDILEKQEHICEQLSRFAELNTSVKERFYGIFDESSTTIS